MPRARQHSLVIMSTSSKSTLRSLLPLAASALIVWAGGILGYLEPTDGALFDHAMRLRSKAKEQAPQVLLVPAEESVGTERERQERLAGAMNRLKERGAKIIVLESSPDWVIEVVKADPDLAARTILGRRPPETEEDWDTSRVALAGAAREPAPEGLRFALAIDPLTAGGVVRRLRLSLPGSQDPTLEMAAALEWGSGNLSNPRTPPLIDFAGGRGSLPRLEIGRLLRGDIVDSLVAGKCAVVGVEPTAAASGFTVATSIPGELMSALELRGQGINTLLQGKLIREPGPLLRLLLVFVALAPSLWIGRLATTRLALHATLALTLLTGAAVAASLLMANTWIPCTELFATQALGFVLQTRERCLELTRSILNLIADSASHLKDRYWPVNSQAGQAPWTLVANMINQTLDLRRLIFVEVDRRTGRLNELLSLECSFKDIAEACRDAGHHVYRDALEAKGPITVKGYLRTADKTEKQYLIPLTFVGELLGFWALSIDASKAAAIPDFEGLLTDYTSRVSELLFHSRSASRAEGDEKSQGLFSDPHGNLSFTLTLLQQRLGALDTLINSLNSGIIVFDIFGRIIQINEMMLTLLKRESLVPFDMTALDVIMALSEYDISKSRKLLRRVIVESSQVSFPVSFRSMPGNRYLINLKPLQDAARREEKGRSRPAGPRAILCELVDTTSIAVMYEMKTKLTESLCRQLRNDLAPVQLSWSLMGSTRLGKSDVATLMEAVDSRIKHAVTALSECQQYLSLDADLDELERFPVDLKEPLHAALEEVQAENRNPLITFQVIEPAFISHVFAGTGKLKEVCKCVFKVLGNDAAENSSIIVRITESDDIVACDFSNMGFGIPNDLLQQYVFGQQSAAAVEMQQLQAAAKWVQAWGGIFECFSGVGVGMHFTVHLVKFL